MGIELKFKFEVLNIWRSISRIKTIAYIQMKWKFKTNVYDEAIENDLATRILHRT